MPVFYLLFKVTEVKVQNFTVKLLKLITENRPEGVLKLENYVKNKESIEKNYEKSF
jgi:hypothetical protein